MNTVTLDKQKLLTIVKHNLKIHKKEYLESVEDYKEAVYSICQRNMDIASSDIIADFKDIKTIPKAPVSYESDYYKNIRMLELSIGESITLKDYEFSQLVLDEWIWKHEFTTSNMAYKSLK